MTDVADVDERDIELLRERIALGDETAWIDLRHLAADLKRDDLVNEVDRRIAEIVASSSTASESLDISLLVDVKHGAPFAIPAELQSTVSVLAEVDGGFWEARKAPLSDALGRYLMNLKDDWVSLDDLDDVNASVLPEGETFWSYFLRTADLAHHVTADGVSFSSPDLDLALLERFLFDRFMLYPSD
jgi:hypothetical protein